MSDFRYDLQSGDSLFEMIGDAGKRRYGNENARIIYEELGLSTASKILFNTHGRKEGKVPMLRHMVLFGEYETFKSEMIRDFYHHLLPSDLRTEEIHQATPRSLIGSIDPDTGDVYAPVFTNNDIVDVEWDSLSSMEKASQITGIFYKAIEEGVIKNSMVSTAKADTDEGEVYGAEPNDWRTDNFNLEFDVNAVVIGVVHMESDFWHDNDKAFYSRWFPVFNDPPPTYVGDARENQALLDQDEREIQRAFRQLFNKEVFSTAYKSVNPDVYKKVFPKYLDTTSPRLSNKANVTLSCKALLEGHFENGEVQPTEEDTEWLKNRMEQRYAPHINEMWSNANTDRTNLKSRNRKLEDQKEIIQYLVENDGATKSQIAREINRPNGTVERWLIEEDGLLDGLLVSEKDESIPGKKPVYRVKGFVEKDE